MTGLDSAAFNALFDATQQSAFRWEGRPTYDVPATDASLQAYLHGEPRPERSVRTSPWLRRIAVQAAAGVHWSRVRRLSDPLSDYDHWSLLAYVESQAAGEEIRIAEPNLALDLPDFWLIDDARAVIMRYDENGHQLGRDPVDDADLLAELIAARDAAFKASVPLNVWLARQAVAHG